MASNIVPPNTVIVNVVKDSQAFVALFGLRSARSRASGPESGSRLNVLNTSVLPVQASASYLATRPEIVESFTAENIKEMLRDGRIVHGNHLLSSSFTEIPSLMPSHASGSSVPAEVVSFSSKLMIVAAGVTSAKR